MLARRGFLGLLGALVAFPVAGWRRIAGYHAGWREIHQQVQGWDCSARYRWSDDRTVAVDWVRMQSVHGVVGPDVNSFFPYPWFIVNYGTHIVSFEESTHATT